MMATVTASLRSRRLISALLSLLFAVGVSRCKAFERAPARTRVMPESSSAAKARVDAGSRSVVEAGGSPSEASDAGVFAPKRAEAGGVRERDRFVGTAFPPEDIPPPFERSAHPGDGRWEVLGDMSKGELSAQQPRVLYQTTIHPHRISRFLSLHLVAVDLARVHLKLVPGTEDLDPQPTHSFEPPLLAGLVPASEQPRLLAVINGGFRARHGRWGFVVAGVTLVPPRAQGCALVSLKNGELALGSWDTLDLSKDQVVFLRQTPPCLVEGGQVHPDLERHRERAWGGHNPKRKTRRRSALGLDESGRVLYYGVGIELEPSDLAEGMRIAGAHAAAQFDINFSWVRFLLFGGADLGVTTSLLPDMVYKKSGYVRRAVARDFFYLVRR